MVQSGPGRFQEGNSEDCAKTERVENLYRNEMMFEEEDEKVLSFSPSA
jgi:hypothetical protein